MKATMIEDNDIRSLCEQFERQGIASLTKKEINNIIRVGIEARLISKKSLSNTENVQKYCAHILQAVSEHFQVRDDERIPHDPFRNMPCDVLLKIADSIPPTDYARFAQISTYVYDCLKTGRGINRIERRCSWPRLNNMEGRP